MALFARLAPTAFAAPVLIMTSFATELATPSVTDVRYLRTDTLPRLTYYKDARVHYFNNKTI